MIGTDYELFYASDLAKALRGFDALSYELQNKLLGVIADRFDNYANLFKEGDYSMILTGKNLTDVMRQIAFVRGYADSAQSPALGTSMDELESALNLKLFREFDSPPKTEAHQSQETKE